MVAYHFPPLAGSSGIQRTLRFAQQLPAFGWEPIVLTADPRAYERTNDDLNADVPASLVVHRAFALDTARHLSIGGRYIGAFARPDRWVSWKIAGVHAGLRLIRQLRPQALWSTYPIATAHLIGAALHRRSGLPWIADFRDPMAQEGYPADPLTRESFVEIEQLAMRHARRNLFTTPGAARMYRERYPFAGSRIGVLENGYDEDSFAKVERECSDRSPLNPGVVTLLHSGIVYPSERDPTQLFAALGSLKRSGRLTAADFRLRFRAAVHDQLLHDLAARHDVADCVEVLPAIGYREALHEMLRADALLVMQGAGCDEQIPAKLYEYLRARRPTLCLSEPAGDTCGALRDAGIGDCARLGSAAEIEAALPDFVRRVRDGTAALPRPEAVRAASRRGRAEALASILDAL